MKAYDENIKYILFINKLITIQDCSTVNRLTIDFLDTFSNRLIKRYFTNIVEQMSFVTSDKRHETWQIMRCFANIVEWTKIFDDISQISWNDFTNVAKQGYFVMAKFCFIDSSIITCTKFHILWYIFKYQVNHPYSVNKSFNN